MGPQSVVSNVVVLIMDGIFKYQLESYEGRVLLTSLMPDPMGLSQTIRFGRIMVFYGRLHHQKLYFLYL